MSASRYNRREELATDQERFEEVRASNDNSNNLDCGLVNDVVTEDFQVIVLRLFLLVPTYQYEILNNNIKKYELDKY